MRIFNPSLDAVDAFSSSNACLFLFKDSFNLASFEGLLDFRLRFRITKLIKNGIFTCSKGELLLFFHKKKPYKKILLVGLGDPGVTDREDLKDIVKKALSMAKKANLDNLVMSIPSNCKWFKSLLFEIFESTEYKENDIILFEGICDEKRYNPI